MVFAELHKKNKKITQNSMQTKYVQQKKFYKTLFLQEETQNIGLKKKILCIQCLGKIVLRIVLI